MGKQFEASPESCRIFKRGLVNYLAGKSSIPMASQSHQLKEKVPPERLKAENKWRQALCRPNSEAFSLCVLTSFPTFEDMKVNLLRLKEKPQFG